MKTKVTVELEDGRAFLYEGELVSIDVDRPVREVWPNAGPTKVFKPTGEINVTVKLCNSEFVG